MTDAVRAFAGWPFNDEEIAEAEDAGYFEAAGRYVPNLLNVLQQAMEDDGPAMDDPDVLGAVSAPVLVLHRSDTRPFFVASARHVADHVPNATLRKIPGTGHASLLTHPQALACSTHRVLLTSAAAGMTRRSTPTRACTCTRSTLRPTC